MDWFPEPAWCWGWAPLSTPHTAGRARPLTVLLSRVLPAPHPQQQAVVSVLGHVSSLALRPGFKSAHRHLLALVGEQAQVLDAPAGAGFGWLGFVLGGRREQGRKCRGEGSVCGRGHSRLTGAWKEARRPKIKTETCKVKNRLQRSPSQTQRPTHLGSQISALPMISSSPFNTNSLTATLAWV